MIVSHSNMKQIQQCDYKFLYSAKMNLKPKEFPLPMRKGIFGHELMEAAFIRMAEGGNYDECVEAASAKLSELLGPAPDSELMECATTYRKVLSFVGYVFQQPWKVVEVENNENWLYNDDQSFGYTPDVVFEWTEGPKKGLPFVLDYKFTGQYWNDRQINTVQQMLKYLIYYNKKHGLQGSTAMRHAGIIMLNTRATASDTGNKLMLLKWLPVSKHKLQVIERENEILVKRIEPYFRMTTDEFREIAVHTPDEFTCKGCWFADDICVQEMNGQDITSSIKANYEINSYGYN